MCLLFSPAHIAHTAHSTHSFLKEKIWMLYFFGLHTSHTLPTESCKKNMDATYYFHLHTPHTPHTLPTASLKKKYGCSLFFWLAHITHTTHSILQEKTWMLPIIFTIHTKELHPRQIFTNH